MRLRRRVFAYVAVAAVASCLLTVGVAVVLVRHRIAQQRVGVLEREAALLAAAGLDRVYRLSGNQIVPARPRVAARVLAQIPASGAGQGTVTVGSHSLLFAERRGAGGRVVVVRPARLAFGEWRPFLISLLLAGLGGALLAGLCAYLLARRLVGPIRALAAATGRVAAGHSGVTVAVDGEDELAQLAHSFNRMSASLTAAQGAQRSFLESVSHELKTPLTSIRGYGEALADGALGPAQAGPVIVGEAGRLERLVGDLLDLARLQRSEFRADKVPVDLGELASRAVDRHRVQAADLDVRLESVAEGPAPALGDPDRLVQAVSNLVENALRVTPSGGTVTVRAEPGVVTVSDTGPGLRSDEVPHAFDRFYLHDRYRSERSVGSGLGLAIVRELVLRMGGQVDVKSASGRGTVFTITVPRDGEAA
ncbi:MAG TPA: HAMP domain-containing sensor histidine kinase [Solirubrobacteraceae bacterium]|nr:HAMP domain-containing sensor histidine kinase [Solirubrobacteraceae bacterium]